MVALLALLFAGAALCGSTCRRRVERRRARSRISGLERRLENIVVEARRTHQLVDSIG